MLLKLGCDPASWVPVSVFTQATPNPSGQRMTFLDLQAQAQSTVIRWRSEFILGSPSCNGEGNHWLGRVGEGRDCLFFLHPPSPSLPHHHSKRDEVEMGSFRKKSPPSKHRWWLCGSSSCVAILPSLVICLWRNPGRIQHITSSSR